MRLLWRALVRRCTTPIVKYNGPWYATICALCRMCTLLNQTFLLSNVFILRIASLVRNSFPVFAKGAEISKRSILIA